MSVRTHEPVRIGVSLEVIHRMLRLPEYAVLVGAELDPGCMAVNFLARNIGGPENAVYMQPVYHRDPDGWPDPIQLLRMLWFDADGHPCAAKEAS